MSKVVFVYADEQEFATFLALLPDKDSAKLLRMIELVQDKGIEIAVQMKWVKKLNNNLYELRSQQANNIQRVIYFHLESTTYVITHGFTKKTQRTPAREINRGMHVRRLYVRKDDNHDSKKS